MSRFVHSIVFNRSQPILGAAKCCFVATFALLCLGNSGSLEARIVSGNNGAKTFSDNAGHYSRPASARAQAHRNQRVAARSEDVFASESVREEGHYAVNIPSASLEFTPSDPLDENYEEVDPSWKGYLHEKGPSRVIVETEIQHEIKPLPEEVWNLIMGGKPAPEPEPKPNPKPEPVTLNPTVVEIPKTQVEEHRRVIPSVEMERETGIHRSEEDDSAITEDEAESYQQLMELFNRPVFAAETSDGTGLVTFRVPDKTSTEMVREGSEATYQVHE